MDDNKQESQSHYGRQPIGGLRTNKSHRAANGKIAVIKFKCSYCSHGKVFINNNANSNKFNQKKCCKCGKLIEDA